MVKNNSLLFMILLALLVTRSVRADEAPIGGTTPDSRPGSAPVIESMKKDNSWYKHALQGVSAPFPQSLQFLEDQGNWYTPFTHPGMRGAYDIRGLHSSK